MNIIPTSPTEPNQMAAVDFDFYFAQEQIKTTF
jgi:hypothetical protein